MKRYTVFLLALLVFMFFLFGCEEKKQEMRVSADDSEFLILTVPGGIEEQTARLIALHLEELGYSSETEVGEVRAADKKGILGVIAVGREAKGFEGLPAVQCSFEMNSSGGENVIAPCLSSGRVARAATLLLPEAEHFTVLSGTLGAADVQDACDILDLSGVDYTVETLETGTVGEALSAAENKGSDALLLSSVELSGGGVEVFGGAAAVFAVGEGEPVKGALASFCIDAEKMAADAAAIAVSCVKGKEAEIRLGSYYVLCISESEAEKFQPDIRAVSEDFRVVMVE